MQMSSLILAMNYMILHGYNTVELYIKGVGQMGVGGKWEAGYSLC